MNAYHDPKRYSRLLSPFVPVSLALAPALYLQTQQAWRLWVPLAVTYLLIPLLDMALGEDRSNPPEEAVPALDADRYYRWVTWAGRDHVALHHFLCLVRRHPGPALARRAGDGHYHRHDGRPSGPAHAAIFDVSQA